MFLLLSAANQIGKSAANIIRLLRMCYLQSYWDKFFGGKKPLQFWYFYPSADLATAEIKEKWVKVYLPKGRMKDDPRWGWRWEIDKKNIKAIHFNSNISVYIKSYQQPPTVLQAATLSGVFCDEEMPLHLFDELNFRGISQKYFYYHNVFTATLGQDYLRRAIECKGRENELFPDAFKRQISMYECLTYADGTPSLVWTKERIAEVIRKCTSEAEVQRRVFGRFVVSTSLVFEAFDYKRNTTPGHIVPKTWTLYCGMDWGSGGSKGHPSAIVYVAVSPDYKQGRVFRTWRGDGIPTTQGDVVSKYVETSKGMTITEAAFDYSAADIGTIASRNGISISKANKKVDETVGLINTLFKNSQLKIYVGPGYEENDKLTGELQSFTTIKSNIDNDLIDALRYCCALVPWQFEIQTTDEEVKIPDPKDKMNKRARFWEYGYEDAELWGDDGDADVSEYMELGDAYGL